MNQPRLPPGWQPAPTPVPEPIGSSTVTIRSLVAVLRRHARLILLVMIVGLAAGVFMAIRETSIYQAIASVRLVSERRTLTNEAEPGAYTSKNVEPIYSLVQLIRGRSVLRAVVDSLGLQFQPLAPAFDANLLDHVSVPPGGIADTVWVSFRQSTLEARLGKRKVTARYGEPVDLGLVRFTVTGPPDVSEVGFAVVPQEQVVDGLNQDLGVVNRQGTDVIDVIMKLPDARMAQRTVNTVVHVFRAYNIRAAQELSRRRREVLAEQIVQNDSLLARAQAALSAFRSRQQLASSRDRLGAQQTELMSLEMEQAKAAADRRIVSELLEQLRNGNDAQRNDAVRTLAASPALANNTAAKGAYGEIAQLQNQLDSMTTGPWALAPSHPDVVQLKSRMESLRNRFGAEVSGQVTALDAYIGTLRTRRGAAGVQIRALPAMAEEEAQLASRVEVLLANGDRLSQDFQKARMAEEVVAGDVDIVDLSALPYKPLWGTGPLKVGLGMLIGFILGCVGAFLLETMNRSIRRPEEIEGMLQIPGLAVIPPLSPGGHSPRSRLGDVLRKRPALPSRTQAGPVGQSAQPFSVGTEAFRMLRTSLVWSDPGEHLKTLVITSTAPGEGKTLTAANLAATFAFEGRRVLLIDCDVRRPRLHGLFRVLRAPGLMELLNRSNGNELSLSPVDLNAAIRTTSVRGLSLLPCGSLPTDASALLSGGRMRALLTHLKGSFDLIVLDTPPVLATADAGILGALADGVLMVVRAGQTDRDAARRAQQHLAHTGARIVGAVLNDPGGEVAFEGDYYYPYDYAAE